MQPSLTRYESADIDGYDAPAHLSTCLVRPPRDAHRNPLPVIVLPVLHDSANQQLVLLYGPRPTYTAFRRHILYDRPSLFYGATLGLLQCQEYAAAH